MKWKGGVGVGERVDDAAELIEGAWPAMNEEEWVRGWGFGALVDEVDVEAFEFRRKMGPLIHYFLFFVPVVLVRPGAVKLCGPLGGEAIITPGIGDDVFGRYSCIFDLPVIPLDFSLGDIDLEWFDLSRHDSVCTMNTRKTTWKHAELIRRVN